MVLVAAAALAVLVGVVYVVLGKGGQLARFEADHPPLALPEDRPVKAFDLGRLMLPLAMWGYHVRAVDELLLRLTATLREREEHIQDLEWRLSRLDPSYVPEGTGPIPGTHLPGDAYAPEQSARGPAGAGSTAVGGFGSGALRPGAVAGPADSTAWGPAPAGATGATAPTAPTEVIEGSEAAEKPENAETEEKSENAARPEGTGSPESSRNPDPDRNPEHDRSPESTRSSGGAEGSDGTGTPGDPTAAGAGKRPEAAGGSGAADASGGSPSRGDEH